MSRTYRRAPWWQDDAFYEKMRPRRNGLLTDAQVCQKEQCKRKRFGDMVRTNYCEGSYTTHESAVPQRLANKVAIRDGLKDLENLYWEAWDFCWDWDHIDDYGYGDDYLLLDEERGFVGMEVGNDR